MIWSIGVHGEARRAYGKHDSCRMLASLDLHAPPFIIPVPNIHTVFLMPPRTVPPPRAPRGPRVATASPSPAALTARQRHILDWIRGYLETTGMPPTRAEIAAGLGFSTPSSAEDHLQALARKGALEILPGTSR